MDAKAIGQIIAAHRKKGKMTQNQLAEKLNISNKTVSRWESGAGFPEITQLPILANIFGVTIDYLLSGKRVGICIAGNVLVDIVKRIKQYPEIGMLSNISDISMAVGGCVPNTAINMAKIDCNIPIEVRGKIGDDEYGRFILSQLGKYGIKYENINISPKTGTSFSDIMSLPSGERTIFHAKGSNSEFSPEDIDISSLNCVLLHIGYILLLDTFDREDPEYGTVMARFLHSVQERGIKTSIDTVSDCSGNFKAKLLPSLKYCDYVIINEIEATNLTDLPPYDDKKELIVENIKKTMLYMAEQGVKEKIIIHCKKAGFCYNVRTDTFTAVPSVKVPSELIKGSVGAGDAFCAASLYGIYNGFDDKHILRFASAAAACNLFEENATDGMLSKNEIEEIEKKFGRQTVAGI
ncbi:MAG: helix-turn-helix domain-containing protein [Ruminococcaceae bacterium]|nr:helix-turn-helix domain-containing protein [Oscillospiraceae bacterium]